jgi:glycosyltransferase involved in cell wall biosynthesis
LVRAFVRLGHQVTVIASRSEDDIGAPVRLVRVPDIVEAVKDLPTQMPRGAGDRRVARALGHLWNNVAVETALHDLLKDGAADVLYERYSPFGGAASLIAPRLGVPHVLEVNAPLAWEGREYRRQALQEAADLIEDLAFRSAGLIIAVSSELKAALIDSGADAAKIAVVPNGVDVDLFQPQGTARRDGLDGKFVVGFVGSLKPWHGVEVLAAAFRRLADDRRFHLLVVGHGPLDKELEALGEDLPGRVTRVGGVPHGEVPAYLRAMDLAVAPYPALDRFYYSPLKVLEYMAAGRAVVASRIGQLGEVLRDGETGVLIPPGDPAALAGAIRRLADDEGLRRAMGQAAHEEARRMHPWTERAARITGLMQGLVS